MKKPRILIHMHYLELGGAEKALIGLLEAIDKGKYDVDLFLNQHTGAYMSSIPTGIRLLPEIPEYSVLERPVWYAIRHGLLKSLWNKVIRVYKMKKYLKNMPGYCAVASHIYMDCVIKSLPSLYGLGEYDLAISFLDPPHIVQDKVRAKKKIEWIHTDFAAIKYDTQLTFNRWSKNDYIISISDDVTKSFCSIFPELKSKIRKVENIISTSLVRAQSNIEPSCPTYSNQSCGLKLCSIGRLNAIPKNFKSIPEIVAILKNKGLVVEWNIIGPGDKAEIEQLIQKYDVGDNVRLLGPKDNPYPYIKECDIYIQPSLFEGKSIAVREAQILCKPVIITSYPTSGSQIENGVDGIICGMENESIAQAIINLSTNDELKDEIISNLKKSDYGMLSEVEKIYEMI